MIISVEVVTDEFFNANPQRYTGLWKKVGTETHPFCGKGDIYLPAKDKIISAQPFPSWTLNAVTDEWDAPKPKPIGNYYWDEKTQSWILSERI